MLNIFKFSLFKSFSFSFSQNSVFKHACATPLTILKSNLEEDLISTESSVLKEISKDRLFSSIEAVNKLVKIIESTTKRNVSNEKFDACSAINEVFCLFYGKIDEECISSRVLINNKLFIIGNKLYFQEVLICVLNNSIEAYGETDKKPINNIIREMSDFLRIDVTDYAKGMSSIMQKIVLLNGVSTKNTGAGLGLYFTKKTIEEIFLGKMSINSAVNFGTHVAWIIPLAKPCSQNL